MLDDAIQYLKDLKSTHWLMGGGGSVGTVLAILFRKQLWEVVAGFCGKAGELIFTYVWNRRDRTKRKDNKMVIIGKLTQQVQDMRRQLMANTKELKIIRPKLERCQIERAECNANYKSLSLNQNILLKRVASLERRIS